jgi:hypothetical protein
LEENDEEVQAPLSTTNRGSVAGAPKNPKVKDFYSNLLSKKAKKKPEES